MKSASFATLAAGVIAGRPTRSYGYDAPQRSYAAQGKEAEYGYDRSYASTEVAPQRGYGYKAPVISKEVGYEGAYGAEAEYDTQVYGDRKGYGSGYGSERSAKGYEYEQGYGKAGYEKPAPKDFYEVSDNKYGYSAPKKTVRVAEKVEYGYGREAGYGVEEKTAPVRRYGRKSAPAYKAPVYEAPVAAYKAPVYEAPVAAYKAPVYEAPRKVAVKGERYGYGRRSGYGRGSRVGRGAGYGRKTGGYKVASYDAPRAVYNPVSTGYVGYGSGGFTSIGGESDDTFVRGVKRTNQKSYNRTPVVVDYSGSAQYGYGGPDQGAGFYYDAGYGNTGTGFDLGSGYGKNGAFSHLSRGRQQGFVGAGAGYGSDAGYSKW